MDQRIQNDRVTEERAHRGRGWRSRGSTRRALARPVLLAGCLLVSAGCGDSLRPELRGAKVHIYLDGAEYAEQTIGLGDEIQLTARVLDATGKVIPGESAIWSTLQPSIVDVSADGGVVATGYGTAHVVARHTIGSDTARINVAAGVVDPLECSAGQVAEIPVGGTLEFAGEATTLICLPGNSSAIAEYAIVTVNSSASGGSVLPVRLRASGVINAGGPPAPEVTGDRTPDVREPRENVEFHERIRAGSSAILEPLLRAGIAADAHGALAGPDAIGLATLAQADVNDLISLNGKISGTPCEVGPPRQGRVRWVSERAVIVEDEANPAGGFTDADYQEFAEFFDADAWPMMTNTFGVPSDIDGNGRVLVFFTVAVNELPENANNLGGDGSFVGGFFFNRDLFPASSCAGSNRAEMFYLMVPDPEGESEPGGRRAFGAEFVRRRVPTLLVHELQHLINDSRRLHINRAPMWEHTWLNEGLSHTAEEMMFFRRAVLQPRQNLRPANLTSEAAREAFRRFHIDNLDRLTAYLDDPDGASLFAADGISTRGAAWSFLRYVADRAPGGEPALWNALVKQSQLAGLDNLRAALGVDPLAWLPDWAVALWADDTGLDSEPHHQLPSWNNRAIYPGLATLMPGRLNQPYPLYAPRLVSGLTRNLPLAGGGAGFARATVAAGGRAAIRATVGGDANLPPPSRLKVVVIRIR